MDQFSLPVDPGASTRDGQTTSPGAAKMIRLAWALVIVSRVACPTVAIADSIDAHFTPLGPAEVLVAKFDHSVEATTAAAYSGMLAIDISNYGYDFPGAPLDAFYYFASTPQPNSKAHWISFGGCGFCPYPSTCNSSHIGPFIIFSEDLGFSSSIPPYDGDHHYRFVIDVGPTAQIITLGFGDCGLYDNSGQYDITLMPVRLGIDSDGDGVDDNEDCAANDATRQVQVVEYPDADADGVSDAIIGVSLCVATGTPPSVGTTYNANGPDNCLVAPNPDQSDVDGDGLGDACDAFPNDPDNEQAQCMADLAQCAEALVECVAASVSDADGDGEVDPRDRCPATPAGEAVDDSGCSHLQFCSRFDAATRDGARACRRADWKNDETIMRVKDRDCMVTRDESQISNCMPTPDSSALGRPSVQD